MNVGLTGGIGCGKSTALKFFSEAGASVLDTDCVAKELLDTDREVRQGVLELFGAGVFTSEGKVDRAALASMVFSNSDKLRALESLVHPKVRTVWQQRLSQNHPLLVVEIPVV
ncbi:MAG: dephospho-CoA kinase [Verrucomicrobia bacterium]|nr:dephospho-CoA kinase [Verrucomicrobiota bacterium]